VSIWRVREQKRAWRSMPQHACSAQDRAGDLQEQHPSCTNHKAALPLENGFIFAVDFARLSLCKWGMPLDWATEIMSLNFELFMRPLVSVYDHGELY
jgi:hypothetical protein